MINMFGCLFNIITVFGNTMVLIHASHSLIFVYHLIYIDHNFNFCLSKLSFFEALFLDWSSFSFRYCDLVIIDSLAKIHLFHFRWKVDVLLN